MVGSDSYEQNDLEEGFKAGGVEFAQGGILMKMNYHLVVMKTFDKRNRLRRT